MKITIDAKDYEPEDNVAISQLLYSVASKFENMSEEEKPVPCTINEHVEIDDWFLYVKITLEDMEG